MSEYHESPAILFRSHQGGECDGPSSVHFPIVTRPFDNLVQVDQALFDSNFQKLSVLSDGGKPDATDTARYRPCKWSDEPCLLRATNQFESDSWSGSYQRHPISHTSPMSSTKTGCQSKSARPVSLTVLPSNIT